MGAICILIISFSYAFAIDGNKPKIYIMLDVDNTLTDRINVAETTLKTRLISNGYKLQYIHFSINKNNRFYNYYKKRLIRHNKKFNPNSDNIDIEELIVIRPTISEMLQSIMNFGESLNIPVHILICSRKDLIRTNALINNLELYINGKLLRELADVVPRENFRLEMSVDGIKTPVKSAKLLRLKYNGKYGKISPHDFVFLIDQLPDNRFLTSDTKRDLNIMIPAFEVENLEQGFNIKSDQEMLEDSVKQIKEFVYSGNF